MIRTMSGRVRKDLHAMVEALYKDADSKLEGYRASCAKWHWLLLVYCVDLNLANRFIMLIQIAFDDHEDLDKDDWWQFMMRIILPEQAIRQIKEGAFSQVPRLAMIDQTDFGEKKDAKEKAQFRMY